MTTLRTFVAIHLSTEAQAALTTLQRRLQTALPANTVRWTTPPQRHLTLHFLGDVPQMDISIITDILNRAALTAAPFELRLAGLGCFPTPQKPRVIWVGIKGETAPLMRLQSELGKRLEAAINVKPDTRPYMPHVTLGRVKQNLTPARVKELGQLLLPEQTKAGQLAHFQVPVIALMRSDLTSAGPEYTTLHSAQLA